MPKTLLNSRVDTEARQALRDTFHERHLAGGGPTGHHPLVLLRPARLAGRPAAPGTAWRTPSSTAPRCSVRPPTRPSLTRPWRSLRNSMIGFCSSSMPCRRCGHWSRFARTTVADLSWSLVSAAITRLGIGRHEAAVREQGRTDATHCHARYICHDERFKLAARRSADRKRCPAGHGRQSPVRTARLPCVSSQLALRARH